MTAVDDEPVHLHYRFCHMSYHIYKDMLEPTIGKQLNCRKDCHNIHDMYAVAIVEGDMFRIQYQQFVICL